MGTGEAAVTLLSEKGVPTPVVHTRMLAPALEDGADRGRRGRSQASPQFAKYGTRVDAQSATEMLAARMEAAAPVPDPPAAKDPPPAHIPAPKLPPAPRAPKPSAGGIGDFLGSREGKALEKQVMRGVFGMLRKRL